MAQAHVVPAQGGPYHSSYGLVKGILGWFVSVDHKKIGLMYAAIMMTFFAVAVILGFTMRLELASPGEMMAADTYNRLFSLHGVIMIFLFIVPGIQAIFGNFLLPLMIGAKDVAFPRLNLFSWYLFVMGGGLAILSMFLPGGTADAGWTFYAPYSVTTETNVTLTVFAAFILGFSSILTGLNFVTTIHRLRAPGMTFFQMPLFVWATYATSWLAVIATPVIGITLALVILEKVMGMGFFNAAMGGDPILYQHLFWIYSHPAVYVMVLPAMGVVSEIIAVFSRRTVFGYRPIAFSSVAIALVGYLVWGHHMFTSGISDASRWVFSFLTYLVAVPTGVKIFNWLATMYKGSIEVRTPMLWTLFFIFTFSVGGLTGLVLGAVGPDIHVHDSYFVVAHFHYVMFGGLAFMLFAAFHMWFPKMFGRMYHEGTAKLSAWIVMVGFNLLYFPMFIMGYEGMPRRYHDYVPEFAELNFISTVGSWILVAGLAIMFANLIRSMITGERAPKNPWGGTTLEWSLPSPPPTENFKQPPRVVRGPYEFDEVVAK